MFLFFFEESQSWKTEWLEMSCGLQKLLLTMGALTVKIRLRTTGFTACDLLKTAPFRRIKKRKNRNCEIFSGSCSPVLQIIFCAVRVLKHWCSPSSAIPSFFRHIGPRAYQSWSVPRECGYAFSSQSPSFLLSPCLSLQASISLVSIHLSSALYMHFSLMQNFLVFS